MLWMREVWTRDLSLMVNSRDPQSHTSALGWVRARVRELDGGLGDGEYAEGRRANLQTT